MTQLSLDNDLAPVYEQVLNRNPHEEEFHQAVHEVISTLDPVLERYPELAEPSLIERLCEPERQLMFRVAWQDDNGRVQTNRGFRVQFNGAMGPYKGGLRFHPSVKLGTVKFLAFEQTFKNALTGLPLGAGKGGSDFNPKGKSDSEVMRFCQSFMNELYRHIGEDTDVPAGDIGVSQREIGYMFGQYRKLTNRFTPAVFTGKHPIYGGSPVRAKATGFGVAAFTQYMLEAREQTLAGKTVVVSGSGNVALHAMQRVEQLGGTVVACSDSDGVMFDPDGLDIDLVYQIKCEDRDRLRRYRDYKQGGDYRKGGNIWTVPCDVALPCATQNELDASDARTLVDGGCLAVGEGANMPCTPEAVAVLQQAQLAYGPGKAANAGGVATSGLEMAQNAQRDPWSEPYTEDRLVGIMKQIHQTCYETAAEFDAPGNYLLGANIAGFTRVARAMLEQGVV